MIKPRKTFHFNPPIEMKGDWMFGLSSLEIYNSIFNKNTINSIFEIYLDKFDEFSIEESKDELEKILSISDITAYHLQQETLGPRITQACRKVG